MEQVLELRKQLYEFAVIEEMMFGVLVVLLVEAAFIMLYTCKISTTTN